ncbi:hypothetical protein GBF35_39960 [Nonomuraea phyllanthi]|nr:hypothetical protein GBF35_39960 [Nonomuraea phyllanthi]
MGRRQLVDAQPHISLPPAQARGFHQAFTPADLAISEYHLRIRPPRPPGQRAANGRIGVAQPASGRRLTVVLDFRQPRREGKDFARGGSAVLDIPDGFQGLLRAHLPYADAGRLTAHDELGALGLDSMGVVRLVVDVEQAYGVELPDELLNETTFATVGSLWQTLSGLWPPLR